MDDDVDSPVICSLLACPGSTEQLQKKDRARGSLAGPPLAQSCMLGPAIMHTKPRTGKMHIIDDPFEVASCAREVLSELFTVSGEQS